MNILQLTDYLPDYSGNFGNTLISIAKHFSTANNTVFISFPEKRKWHTAIEKVGGKLIYVPVYKFKKKKIDLYAIKILNRIIRLNDISVVHVHFGLSQKITSIILKILKPSIKIIWHWRGDIDDNMNLLKKIQAFIFYRTTSFFFVKAHIANSINIKDRLVEKKLLSFKKIVTLPNAIDIDLFDKNKYCEEIDSLRSEFNSINIATLIMVRNFRNRVDFNIILDTMQVLQDKNKNVQLIWIGYGESMASIAKEIESRQLMNIKLLGKRENPIPYYYISHINIIAWEPWCNETINNTVYEALICGIPVVGLNFGGLPRSFNESEGVYTVPLNPNEYASKLSYILENQNIIKNSVKKGKEKILNEFSLTGYLKELQLLYNL